MFGGVAFLLHGNLAYGILNDDLIVRIGPEAYEEALNSTHTLEFDITGRSWVMVSSKGLGSEEDLAAWVQRGVSFARSLPKK